MKPTRDDLERWAEDDDCTWLTGEARACLKRTARYALDLEREVERLRGAIDRHGLGGQHAPSPLLDDALWRRVFAAALIAQHGVTVECATRDADALLAALREREGVK